MATYNVDLQDSNGNSYRPMANPDSKAEFSAAGTRANIASGESHRTLWGKVYKWFADLKAVAFTGSYGDLANKPSIPGGAAASQGVANNCTTTAAGYVLDARQGKTLMDKANQISSDLASARQSFQAGCSTIAAAITAMGVATASNASPATMAANIQAIKNAASGTFKNTIALKTISCGFRPSAVAIINLNTTRRSILIYDASISTAHMFLAYSNSAVCQYTFGGLDINNNRQDDIIRFSITDSGFAYTRHIGYDDDTMHWFAFK